MKNKGYAKFWGVNKALWETSGVWVGNAWTKTACA